LTGAGACDLTLTSACCFEQQETIAVAEDKQKGASALVDSLDLGVGAEGNELDYVGFFNYLFF